MNFTTTTGAATIHKQERATRYPIALVALRNGERTMRRKLATAVAAGVASAVVAALHAGGWVVVSLRDLPEYAVAGKPLPLRFMVRQHGVEPLGGLEPIVTVSSSTRTVSVPAVPTRKTGEYAATLVLPHPGRWTIRIATVAFNESTLHALPVIVDGSPAPPPLSPPALGERLFVAKGCIGCHANRELRSGDMADVFKTFGSGSGAPDLTGKRFADAYVKSLLADPAATRGPDAGMPDLGLARSEITALTAFINRER
jgi:hypothetical protein